MFVGVLCYTNEGQNLPKEFSFIYISDKYFSHWDKKEHQKLFPFKAW